MLRIACILKVSKVHVRHSLVWFVHDANANISVFLIFSVQRITYNIIARFRVERTDAEHFITCALWGRTPAARRSAHRTPTTVTHL
jgi:hypothetical protein